VPVGLPLVVGLLADSDSDSVSVAAATAETRFARADEKHP